jgi:hypothetical protein
LGDVGLGDVGLGDVGLGEVGLGDVGLGEVGLGDVGLEDVGLREVGLAEGLMELLSLGLFDDFALLNDFAVLAVPSVSFMMKTISVLKKLIDPILPKPLNSSLDSIDM